MKATKRNKQTVKEDLSRRKKHQVLYTTYLKKNRPFLFLLQIDRIFPGVFRDWSKSMGGGGLSREGVGHEVLSLVQGVGRTIFQLPLGGGSPYFITQIGTNY